MPDSPTDSFLPNPDFGLFASQAQCTVGFLLAPTFSMLPFVSAVECLRVANRLSGRALYDWPVVGETLGPITANNGLSHPARVSIEDSADYSIVLVCGAHSPQAYHNQRVCNWLRRLASKGVRLGAIETGSYILAQARLLDGYRCTIHWENLPGFRAAFPHLRASSEMFEFDRNRMTCAGGTAALDMMLQLVEEQHGIDLAVACAENFMHHSIRRPGEAQRMNLRARTGITNRNLLECLELMEANIEQPLTPSELAAAVGVSKRQLERLFQRYLDATPSRHYTGLRLRAARRLLEQTSLAVTDVALACGFPSPGYFSHRYRLLFGLSPSEERAAGLRRGTASTRVR